MLEWLIELNSSSTLVNLATDILGLSETIYVAISVGGCVTIYCKRPHNLGYFLLTKTATSNSAFKEFSHFMKHCRIVHATVSAANCLLVNWKKTNKYKKFCFNNRVNSSVNSITPHTNWNNFNINRWKWARRPECCGLQIDRLFYARSDINNVNIKVDFAIKFFMWSEVKVFKHWNVD